MAEPNYEFLLRQQEALEKMRQMQKSAQRGRNAVPPSPAFLKVGEGSLPNNAPKGSLSEEKNSENKKDIGAIGFAEGILSGGGEFLNSFLGKIGADPDILLIIGLLLILQSEKSDKLLLLALLYILL